MYTKRNNLLISKMILINGIVFFYFLYNMYMGMYEKILEADQTKITFIIIAIALFGIFLSLLKGIKINKYINSIKEDNVNFVLKNYLGEEKNLLKDKNDELFRKTLEMSLMDYLVEIRYISMILPLLGLIGTIIGFVLILSIPADLILNITIEKIPELILTLFSGLGIALYTTLAGACGYLWVGYNYHMLRRASIQLYRSILKNMP